MNEKRERLKSETKETSDFLSLLLTDDLYKDDEELIKDELSTFILASSQTTATLISNTLYFTEFVPGISQKLRAEIR